MSKDSKVVCASCGQPVSANQAELLWDDPDGEADEYKCEDCSDDEFADFMNAETGMFDDYEDDLDDLI
jgi:DNA-directed RNA polymerase subunit RPC12/RpoP